MSPLLSLLFCSLAILLPFALQQPVETIKSPPGIEHARLVDIQLLRGTLYHVQGVDIDASHIWVTSVDKANHKGYLHQFSRNTGQLERQIDVTDGPRFHPGGFSIYGNSIWIPIAEYSPNSTAVLEEFDKKTLKLKRRIFVRDHLGCVAAMPQGLIGGNWGSRKFYVFSFGGRQLRRIDNPSQTQYQDMKFVNHQLVASGYLTSTSGSIDWYSWPGMKLLHSVRSFATDRGVPFTGEGMTLNGNSLYLVPEDGPSRMFHFEWHERGQWF